MISRTAVVTQPTYLPWLGYFEQIARSDVFVFLDTVQFDRRSWQSRNRFRGSNGEPFWLTVPVHSHPRETLINQIRISPQDKTWSVKHLNAIKHALTRAPFFSEVFPHLEAWLHEPHKLLVELNIQGILVLKDLLGLSTEVFRSSQLQATGRKAELIVNICREVGATHYYTSAGARGYIEGNRRHFDDASIRVQYQSWEHPVYRQTAPGFVSHLSAVDALMNIGPDAACKAVRDKSTASAQGSQ